jgi:predicted amidohydrolase
MSRKLVVAAAQLGPIPVAASRAQTIERLVRLLNSAADEGAELVVFPELALTPFFPHWLIEDDNELRGYYEKSIRSNNTQPLFDAAAMRRISFVLGFAEETGDGRLYNTAALIADDGGELLRYRKIHLPGFSEYHPAAPHQNLEKRYFEVGDSGFRAVRWHQTTVGLAICNDRRWAETYRMLALKGAEIVCIGYNTPVRTPHLPETDHLTDFHNHLSMQAGAYQNSLWVVGAAKAGLEEGVDQIGGSAIIAPSGEIIACANTKDDELVIAEIDLDMSTRYRKDIFNFTQHRRPEHYGLIAEQARGKVATE